MLKLPEIIFKVDNSNSYLLLILFNIIYRFKYFKHSGTVRSRLNTIEKHKYLLFFIQPCILQNTNLMDFCFPSPPATFVAFSIPGLLKLKNKTFLDSRVLSPEEFICNAVYRLEDDI